MLIQLELSAHFGVVSVNLNECVLITFTLCVNLDILILAGSDHLLVSVNVVLGMLCRYEMYMYTCGVCLHVYMCLLMQ